MLKCTYNNQQDVGNLWITGNLLRNVYVGSGKMQEHENHADDVHTRQTDELWWITSQPHHNHITQNNHTDQSHI